MSKYLLLVGLTGILFSCGGETEMSEKERTEETETQTYCDCSELFFDEPYNRFYLDDPKEPFTGKCEGFHPNGELALEKNFKEGKVHGKMITYFDNGLKKDEREFEDNFQVGEQITRNRRGEIVYHALYERGKLKEILVTRPDLKNQRE